MRATVGGGGAADRPLLTRDPRREGERKAWGAWGEEGGLPPGRALRPLAEGRSGMGRPRRPARSPGPRPGLRPQLPPRQPRRCSSEARGQMTHCRLIAALNNFALHPEARVAAAGERARAAGDAGALRARLCPPPTRRGPACGGAPELAAPALAAQARRVLASGTPEAACVWRGPHPRRPRAGAPRPRSTGTVCPATVRRSPFLRLPGRLRGIDSSRDRFAKERAPLYF